MRFLRFAECFRYLVVGFMAFRAASPQGSGARSAGKLGIWNCPKIYAFFKASKGCYGSKRVHKDLVADGEVVSERRVARIMRENKISPRQKKRGKPITTDAIK